MDTTKQIRIPVAEVGQVIKQFSDGSITWAQAMEKYPVFVFNEEKE